MSGLPWDDHGTTAPLAANPAATAAAGGHGRESPATHRIRRGGGTSYSVAHRACINPPATPGLQSGEAKVSRLAGENLSEFVARFGDHGHLLGGGMAIWQGPATEFGNVAEMGGWIFSILEATAAEDAANSQ